jgi:hypothetical protein
MFLRLSSIEADDRHGHGDWDVHEVPVIKELMDDLAGLVYLELAELLDGVEVLGIERTQAGSVEVSVQHSMVFT